MKEIFLEKTKNYDKNGSIRSSIDNAMKLLQDFRVKYPFVENPEAIDSFSPDDVFKEQTGEVGDFFHWLEYYLKPIGHLTIYGTAVYKSIRKQFEDFKDLLYVLIDKKKSLAQKVDAQWGEITHLGGDRHIAKKIIFCFNYESNEVLPIFKTDHMAYFCSELVDKPSYPAQYYSLGEKYAYLTSELLKLKDGSPQTKSWVLPYFSRFLYDCFSPPSIDKHKNYSGEKTSALKEIATEQLAFREFVKLMGELQTKGKLSGEQFRNNRELWKNNPQDRDAIVERLRLLLK